MPLDSQHINQAKHNIAFLESFYNSYKYNDWSITVAFYEAPENITVGPFSTHTQRNIIVKENFPDVADWFMLLYRESINARYNKYNFSDNEVNLLVKPALENIIKWSNQNYRTDFSISLK